MICSLLVPKLFYDLWSYLRWWFHARCIQHKCFWHVVIQGIDDAHGTNPYNYVISLENNNKHPMVSLWRRCMWCLFWVHCVICMLFSHFNAACSIVLYPDSKVHGANMGPIWGRQDPDWLHIGPMKIAIWIYTMLQFGVDCKLNEFVRITWIPDKNNLWSNSNWSKVLWQSNKKRFSWTDVNEGFKA